MNTAKATLVTQANTLDAIFNALALKSIPYLDSEAALGEKHLWFALRAQVQCRATFGNFIRD